jgi:hypothetical protein
VATIPATTSQRPPGVRRKGTQHPYLLVYKYSKIPRGGRESWPDPLQTARTGRVAYFSLKSTSSIVIKYLPLENTLCELYGREVLTQTMRFNTLILRGASLLQHRFFHLRRQSRRRLEYAPLLSSDASDSLLISSLQIASSSAQLYDYIKLFLENRLNLWTSPSPDSSLHLPGWNIAGQTQPSSLLSGILANCIITAFPKY